LRDFGRNFPGLFWTQELQILFRFLYPAWVVFLSIPMFAFVVHAAQDAPVQQPQAYRIARGDELNFRFFFTPELNTVATVRSDGMVALPLIGEIQVDGLSVTELTTRVEQLLASQVRRPQVIVNIQGGTSQRVFVGGEVMRPGVQPLLGPLTVLQAVMVAEGLKDGAQPSHVIVLRRGATGERNVLSVDLSAAISGRDLAQDLPLQAFDVIVVPRSGVADLGVWVDQYIRRVIPFNLGFSYTINKNGTVQ
jgi:polysaccharide export outer membrane protein